ncbi:MAG: hypothetical protein ACK55I_47895, partial [bacterium]
DQTVFGNDLVLEHLHPKLRRRYLRRLALAALDNLANAANRGRHSFLQRLRQIQLFTRDDLEQILGFTKRHAFATVDTSPDVA